ncbi:MAG: beta-lactamase family protein [Ruminococcaceae bacterium]|nr:beta-lactamase family protein [Oscillospiraceae bacterium]
MSFKKLDNYMKDTLYKDSSIPGCDIIIKQGHKTLFRAQYGYADMANKTAVDPKSQYCLYSCTKPVTVAGAMRLVEEGRLELDVPASRYIPAFADAFLLVDGVKKAPQKEITVRDLFTMSAGFTYSFATDPIQRLFESEDKVSTVDLARAAVASPLEFEPGEHFRYSMCHDLLGAVVEAVSDMPFGDYQKKVIFEPLGMKSTGFLTTLKEPPTLPPLYGVDVNTKDVVSEDRIYHHGLRNNYESGGAGMISTVEDYSLFADTMACGGTSADGYRLLRSETVKLIHSEQLKSFTVNAAFTCAAGAGYGYGLGVRTLVNKDEGQRSPLGEFGWDGAAGSYVLMDTKNKVSVFFATHLLRWPARLGTLHAPIRDLTYECLEL